MKKKKIVTSDDDHKMALEPVQDISGKSDDNSPMTKRKVKTETEPETVSEPKKKNTVRARQPQGVAKGVLDGEGEEGTGEEDEEEN